MKESELKKYYNVYTEAWKFFKKHSDVKDESKYWNDLTYEARDLVKKYGDTDFATAIFAETIKELSRISRKKREGIDCPERGHEA